MDQLKNETLKKSFFLTVLVTAILVFLLSAASVGICTKIHNQITLSHAFIMNGTTVSPENGRYIMETDSNSLVKDFSQYTNAELWICRITEFMAVGLPVLFSISGIGCAGTYFYHTKLKKPLKALQQGIRHIADNDLDFTMDYQKQDEFGELCRAFESMRQALVKNNRHMWNLLEERRKINASISHDLRTPITVIKGYSEYLDQNADKGILTEAGTREIAVYIHQAASRLEEYANSVHEIQSLEDMRLDYQKVSLQELGEEISSQLSVIARQKKKEILFSSTLPQKDVLLSPADVFRITENIIANALRYCKEKIEVEFNFSKPFLSITITDDGEGFSPRDLVEATDYFYKGKSSKSHFGIGLSICKMLAKKHGGQLLLDNAPQKGARVNIKIKTENPPVL